MAIENLPDNGPYTNPLPSASIHEAAGRIGALPGRIRPVFDSGITAAPTLTVSCPAGDNLWIHRAVAMAEPHTALLISTPQDAEFGYWGEILSEAAAARRISAVVIDGGVRDTAALESVGVPVYASAVSIRGTGKNTDLAGSIGRTLRFGDVDVSPGDILICDADGVVAIPADRYSEATEAAQLREDKEAAFIDAIRRGESTMSLFNLPE